MRSVQPCSAATCTAVRWSLLRTQEGHPMPVKHFTASTLFQAAAQYSGVHSSLSFTTGSQPCAASDVMRAEHWGAADEDASCYAGHRSGTAQPQMTPWQGARRDDQQLTNAHS